LLLGDCDWHNNLLYLDLGDYEVTILVANALLDRAVVFFGLCWHFLLLGSRGNDLTNGCSLTDFFALFFGVVGVVGPILAGGLLLGFSINFLSFSHFLINYLL
jgi:hypothetical protein